MSGGRTLAALLVLWLAGCPAPTRTCAKDDQCDPGEVCSGGTCTGACTPACAQGEVCDDGKCFPEDCGDRLCPENAFCLGAACVFHGCRNRTCKADQVCVTGGLCVDQNCADEPCEDGQVCAGGGKCTDPACYRVTCGDEQKCFDGACKDLDCDGRLCPGNFCADGAHCKDCPNQTCLPDYVCIAGSCQSKECASRPESSWCDNDCRAAGTACRAGQVCVKGACMSQSCPGQSCLEGSYCAGERCAPAACADKPCEAGAVCAADGACHPTSCDGRPCSEGFACDKGRCVSVLCLGVDCGPNAACLGGGCFSTLGCKPGELFIAGACRQGPSAPCASPCPDGFSCVDGNCASAACLGVVCDAAETCEGGACYPTGGCAPGELLVAGSCVPGGAGPVACGGRTCPDGFTCKDGACLALACVGVGCPAGQACWQGACQPVSTCPAGQVMVEDACRPVDALEACGGSSCDLGFWCDTDGLCVALCDFVTCTTGTGCWAGACYPSTGCPAGEVKVAGVCQQEGPPPSCAHVECGPDEGCVAGACQPRGGCTAPEVSDGEGGCVAPQDPPPNCNTMLCGGVCCEDGTVCDEGACAPLECLGQLAGCVPCGGTACLPPSRCAGDRCLSPCESCGEGRVCVNGDTPPCLDDACAGVACPDDQHCVHTDAAPNWACVPDLCPDGADPEGGTQELCEPWEECVSDRCVESTCKNVTCGPKQVCTMGHCLDQCCPAPAECSGKTVCVDGRTFFRNCPNRLCPQGTLCAGDHCSSVLVGGGCTEASEAFFCDGKDTDCSGLADDGVMQPGAVSIVPARNDLPSGSSAHPQLLQRKPCGRCDFADSTDLTCVRNFTDGRAVYLLQGDTNPVGTPGTPHTRWTDDGTVAWEASCVRMAMPAGCKTHLDVTEVTLGVHGVGVVPCDKTKLPCVGSDCYTTLVDLYYHRPGASLAKSNNYGWTRLCTRRIWMDDMRLTPCRINSAQTSTVPMDALLLCKRVPKAAKLAEGAEYNHVSVDGVSITGCCHR